MHIPLYIHDYSYELLLFHFFVVTGGSCTYSYYLLRLRFFVEAENLVGLGNQKSVSVITCSGEKFYFSTVIANVFPINIHAQLFILMYICCNFSVDFLFLILLVLYLHLKSPVV